MQFVDSNSAPNGRKEGSHGATYYFNPLECGLTHREHYDCTCIDIACASLMLGVHGKVKILEEEGLNTVSVGTFYSWLKQHRPYVGICPAQSDYYDKCKEHNEEIARARQIINRLKQSRNSGAEPICEQEQSMVPLGSQESLKR